MQPERFILASRSPQRVRLLTDAGYAFDAVPADIDEEAYSPDLEPADVAAFLARSKCLAVSAWHPGRVILAADTVVAVDRRLLGKPDDADDACRMLELLSDSTHHVITGVALLRPGFAPVVSQDVSLVHMRALHDDEITAYVLSKQWQGKAGGYGIQDNDPFVVRMSGSHTNIVGLPMERVADLLATYGIRPR